MGECLITRRGGEIYKLPILDSNYPEDVSTTVIKGNTTSATFTAVIAESGNPAFYTYQWYVNGTAVEGANGSSYTKDDLTDTVTYTVYCEVTNKKGTVTTRIATLEVVQRFTPVLNASYPEDVTANEGTSYTSKVVIDTAGNPASYTYQWYKNGTAIDGATNDSYTFTPTAGGTVTLYCEVTNQAGTVSSRTATITVERLLFDRSTQPYSNIAANIGIVYEPEKSIVSDANPYVRMSTMESNIPRAWQWNQQINFADYKTIEVVGYCAGGGGCKFGISTALQSDPPNTCSVAAQDFTGSVTTLYLDISSVNTFGYIDFYAYQQRDIYVRSVKLK